MKVRHVGPNQWEIYQSVPNPSGLSSAPPVEQVVMTLTDADVASLLNSFEAVDQETSKVTDLMAAHAANAALVPASAIAPAGVDQTAAAPPPSDPPPAAVPVDVVAEHVATGEGMPEPETQS